MKNNTKNKIRHFETFFVTIVLITTTLSFFAVASDNSNIIFEKYSFGTPYLQKVTIDGLQYDKINLDNLPNFGDIGKYNLPRRSVSLLINQGEDIVDIQVTHGERIFFGSNFNIEPTTVPISLSEQYISKAIPQKEVDSDLNYVYPETLYDNVGTYWFRGYKILVLLLYPVQYIPETQSLYYFKDINVKITTIKTNQINPNLRFKMEDEMEVIKRVDNPSAVNSYKLTNGCPLSSNSYDLLILTTERFKDAFKPLKEAHESQGLATKIKTLRDISLIPSTIKPDDIRDFIRNEYRKNGIGYVLIGGDDEIIPAQKLWVQSWNHGETTLMPSDLFYACLDGTYNFDNDENWGEPSDGDEGKNLDLYAEVYVGRACVDIMSDAYNFIDKTIDYINSGGYSSGKTLMVGEYLWSDPDTWGGDYMDEMIDGANTNGYSTVGIPSDVYEIDTLYDREWGGNDWPKSAIKSKISDGALILNHLGHSSYGYNMKMVNNDVLSLDNDAPIFIYSQGCMAGGFDNPDDYDCIAEYFTVKTDKAAFAVIMNARYGWGSVGSTNGPSQRYHREFWDAIFSENINEIGKANQDSKEDALPYINYACMRWCYYQLNLFGDPALVFNINNNIQPDTPNKPSGLKNGATEVEYEFSTSTKDSDGDKLYFKWSWGDGTFSDWLGPYESYEEVVITHKWEKMGIYNVKVKARDEHRAESDWSDPLPIAMPKYHQFSFAELSIKILERYFPQIYTIINNLL